MNIIDSYRFPFYQQIGDDGWHLEHYDFHKRQNGSYVVSIQAGDRMTGGTREYKIPADKLTGTYEEFLNVYLDKILHHFCYGVGYDELLSDGGLKAFLGFTPKKEHPDVTVVELPARTILGDYELCQGKPELPLKVHGKPEDADRIRNLWTDIMAKSALADYAVEAKDGVCTAYWGVMNDGLPVNGFKPWREHYKTGYYMAGVERKPDRNVHDSRLGIEWEIPAARYVVTEVNPDNYDEVFHAYVNTIIPEMGLTLNGGICEYIKPGEQSFKLYFPVRDLV